MDARKAVIATLAVAALLVAGGLALAQPAPQEEALQRAADALQAQIAQLQARGMQEQAAELQKRLDEVTRNLGDVRRELAVPAPMPMPMAGMPPLPQQPNQPAFRALERYRQMLETSRSAPVLVVPARADSGLDVAGAREDMSVMARILIRAVSDSVVGPRPSDIGALAVANLECRPLFLEGYGAVFTMDVPLLLKPREGAEPERPAQEPQSLWERTRREMYGGPALAESDMPFGPRMNAPGPGYDPDRVAALQQAVVDILKEAGNIRGLKADDAVVVILQGRPTGGMVILSGADVFGPVEFIGSDFPSGTPTMGQPSVMVLRTRKADVDALAQGRLAPDAFNEKVAVTVY